MRDKTFFAIAVLSVIFLTYQLIRGIDNNYKLQQELVEMKQVVQVLETKLVESEAVERGLRIELEKIQKRYNECNRMRDVVRRARGKEIQIPNVIPLPDMSVLKIDGGQMNAEDKN